MLQLELPHVNVLSKVDLLQTAGDLRKLFIQATEDAELTRLCSI